MRQAGIDDFLPAALAIEARPPSPLGRSLVWLIVLLCTAAAAWSIIGRVDIVTIAPGRIIPSGHSRPVQAPRLGQVESVRVTEGDEVAEGDVLIELDVEQASADLAHIDVEIHGIEVDIMRYRRLLTLLTQHHQGMDGAATETGDSTARGRWQHYLDEQELLKREREQRVADKRHSERELDKPQAIQPLIDEIAGDERGLAEQKLLASHRMLQSEQRRLEVLHDLRIAENRIVEQDRALDAIDARSKLLRSEREREWRDRLDADTRRLDGLRQQRVKAQEQLQRSRVTAPVSGRVQQLVVHGPGAVVSAGQTLLHIVPQDAGLEIQAELMNRDVGFVEVGQAVVVKVDTFPFHPLRHHQRGVSGLSADAMAATADGSMYGLRVSLEHDHLEQDGRQIPLMAGMKVTVEAKTGRRRLVEYFLDPLLRGLDESVRER